MRFIALFIFFSLSACVNYAGIHTHSHTTPEEQFAAPKRPDVAWWQHFHDDHLTHYIETGLSQSPTIQIAASRIDLARAKSGAAGSALWPSINANTQIQRERISANTIYPPPYGGNTYTETNLGLNFQYELDFWGKNREALAAKISEESVAITEKESAELMLSTTIAAAYVELQAETAGLQLKQNLLNVEQELLQILQTRVTRGVESDIPLDTAEANVESVKLELAALTEKIKSSQNEIAALLGQNAFDTVIVAAPFRYEKQAVALPTNIPLNLLGRKPEIIAARTRIEVAAHNVNVAKSRFYPNINLLGLLSLQSYTLGQALNPGSRDNILGLALDLPIFDANERRAQLTGQYAEYDMAVAEYHQSLIIGLRDVSNAENRLKQLEIQEISEANLLKSKANKAKLQRVLYQHGISDYAHVLEARANLLIEQDHQLQLQATHYQTALALIKAVAGNYQGIKE